MRKKKWVTAALAVGLCLSLLLPVADAQKGKPNPEQEKKEQEKQVAEAMADLTLAYQLEHFGRTYNAPEALITAGRLLQKASGVQMKKLEVEGKIESGHDKDSGDKKDALVDDTAPVKSLSEQADSLFKEARDMATIKGLKLEALIKQAKEEKIGTRALFGGPRQLSRQIGPGQWQAIHVRAVPHQPVQFSFRATIPMRLEVVRSDTDHVWGSGILPAAQTVFHPGGSRTGFVPVTVRVINISRQRAAYQLFMY